VLILQQGKDWMLQLLSVACISLAAKMEESEVPILLDLQVCAPIAFLYCYYSLASVVLLLVSLGSQQRL